MITRYRITLTDPTGQVFYLKRFFANGSPDFTIYFHEASVDCNLNNYKILRAAYASQPGYKVGYHTTIIPTPQR